jgi:hypothetical protein
MNLLFDCVEANPFSSSHELYSVYEGISLYENNGSGNATDVSNRNNGEWYIWPTTYKMDNTINYPGLLRLQEWTFPLEDIIFNATSVFISKLEQDSSLVASGTLADFSDYCNAFVYSNYRNQSYKYVNWSYTIPSSGSGSGSGGSEPGTVIDPGDADTSTNAEKALGGSSGSGGGCGSSATASTGVRDASTDMPGFISLMITMLFPLFLILMHRTRRKRRTVKNC